MRIRKRNVILLAFERQPEDNLVRRSRTNDPGIGNAQFLVGPCFDNNPILDYISVKESQLWTLKVDCKANILSAFWMVLRRCAMAMVVRFFAALSKAFWTTFSLSESSADVA